MDAHQAAANFLAEIKDGLVETRNSDPVYPGFIKIAVRETIKKTPLIYWKRQWLPV